MFDVVCYVSNSIVPIDSHSCNGEKSDQVDKVIVVLVKHIGKNKHDKNGINGNILIIIIQCHTSWNAAIEIGCDWCVGLLVPLQY